MVCSLCQLVLKNCHRRTTEHELNRVANSSSRQKIELSSGKTYGDEIRIPRHDSPEDWRAVFSVVIGNPSDPRRRAEAPVVTYSALSSRWRGLSVSDVRTCPTPYALDALAQPSNRNLAPSYRETNLLSKQLPCQVIAFTCHRCSFE